MPKSPAGRTEKPCFQAPARPAKNGIPRSPEQTEENELFAKNRKPKPADIFRRFTLEKDNVPPRKRHDKALVNYYRAYENDKTDEDYLRLCYQAADSVLPEYLTLDRSTQFGIFNSARIAAIWFPASSGNLQFITSEHRNDFVLRSNWTAESFIF